MSRRASTQDISRREIDERVELLCDAIEDLEAREVELTVPETSPRHELASHLLEDVKTAITACVRVLEIDLAALAGSGATNQRGTLTFRAHEGTTHDSC